jgi:hypothetical protein
MGVTDVLFCRQCSRSFLLTKNSQLYIHLAFINFFPLSPVSTSFRPFCRLLSIGCTTALPMGVAPEAIAKNFGYRLKRIGKFDPYTSSRIICWFCLLWNRFSPSSEHKPPSRRWGELVLLGRYFLIFARIFSLDMINSSVLILHYKNPTVYFGPCCSKGPLARAYK